MSELILNTYTHVSKKYLSQTFKTVSLLHLSILNKLKVVHILQKEWLFFYNVYFVRINK